jgi:hypothetical protein
VACALNLIASGAAEHTQVVFDAGAESFIPLLSSPDIKFLAVWALGNILGENPKHCDSLLHQNAL